MIRNWWPSKIGETKDSPGRAYSDNFLYENLSRLLLEEKVKMIDIGCGSGYIRKIFYDLGYKLLYVGIDIEKHKNFGQFSEYSEKSNFVKTKIEDFSTNDKYNLVFSNCALEHIENDYLAASKSFYFLEKNGIQIHIVPTFWSLFLYFKHGYRRYTLSRLKRMFPVNFDVYKIGGFFSFMFHLFFITIPEVFIKTNKPRQSRIYSKLLILSRKLDRILPFCPSFYLLIIKDKDDRA